MKNFIRALRRPASTDEIYTIITIACRCNPALSSGTVYGNRTELAMTIAEGLRELGPLPLRIEVLAPASKASAASVPPADAYRVAWLEMTEHCNTIKAERFRLEQTIRDSIEALERNSTTAPVVECLKAAVAPEPAPDADMLHLAQLQSVADADVGVITSKEQTYQGSWKAAGGRSAWFMLRRNIDRLLKMMLTADARTSEDIFAQIELRPDGADGTPLACLRDLRRYALLVEAEMVARGVVRVERGEPRRPADANSRGIASGPLAGQRTRMANVAAHAL